MNSRSSISALTQSIDQAGTCALLALQCVFTEGDYTAAFMNADKICMYQLTMMKQQPLAYAFATHRTAKLFQIIIEPNH